MPHQSPHKQVVIIGAGPAGLAAAYELTKFNWHPIVLEKHNGVGGLARTENYKGFYFDMGGHRFFTKVEEVQKMWTEVLRDDFLRRPRLSRIYYNGRFFNYPLKPFNALLNLGLFQSILVVLSYLRWQLFPYRREDTFEEWVTNRFGRRLFRTFFKTYTEKVWGIPCSELKAEWAAQRIKDLSLRTALVSMFLKPKDTIKTLIEEFEYPRLGPGMMWNAVKEEVERRSGEVRLNSEVLRINRAGNHIESVVTSCEGREQVIPVRQCISSMPVTEFIKKLDPPAPPEVRGAAEGLTYRDFLTVCLIVKRPQLFPDNWIYIHSPDVRVGRIQNFKNWSRDMVPDPTKTSLGLEYFCTEGDAVWNTSDADLIELGKQEVDRIGLARSTEIEDGCVVRVPKAYPVYDSDYRDHLAVVREFVESLENFQPVGRNGLHRYNNQDHAMLTGMLAVRNVVLGQRNDLWNVNTEREYHEEIHAGREAEASEIERALEAALVRVFLKVDRMALGCSMGVAGGGLLGLATISLALTGGDVIGLRLLSQYFPGYAVSLPGSVIGAAYGFLTGWLGGWAFAFLRNTTLFLYMMGTRRRAERQVLGTLFDYV